MNEATWCALNNEIAIRMHSEEEAISNLTEAEMATEEPGVDAALEYMNVSIKKAIDKRVPERSKSVDIKRRVSDKTRVIYEERTKQGLERGLRADVGTTRSRRPT